MPDRYSLRNIFRERMFIFAIFFLFLQQVIVALSIYFLARSAVEISAPEVAVLWFGGYLICLVAPYPPGILAGFFFSLWEVHAVRSYQRYAARCNPYDALDYPLRDLGSARVSNFANTGPSVITHACSYVSDIFSSGLNSLISILAIALIVDMTIAVSYGVSLILCMMYTYFFSDLAKLRSEVAEKRRIDLVSHTHQLWAPMTLGNGFLCDCWRRRFEEFFDCYICAYRSESVLQNFSGLALSLICVLPTTILMGILFYRNMGDVGYLSALLVSAPRALQILTMLGHVSSLAFGLNKVLGQFRTLNMFFSVPEAVSRLICYDKISVSHNGGESVLLSSDRDFFNFIEGCERGRILVRGSNGCGKTTLLLCLKRRLGLDSFFLPSASIFDDGFEGSTGERKYREISAVLCDDALRYILLDEWDANLDMFHMDKIDSLLDEASGSRLIIEVRHHGR